MPKKVEQKPADTPGRVEAEIQINKFTVMKGITMPMEKLGGEKYEMMRVDVGLEVAGEATRERLDAAWKQIDEEVNKQFNDEVEAIKEKGN